MSDQNGDLLFFRHICQGGSNFFCHNGSSDTTSTTRPRGHKDNEVTLTKRTSTYLASMLSRTHKSSHLKVENYKLGAPISRIISLKSTTKRHINEKQSRLAPQVTYIQQRQTFINYSRATDLSLFSNRRNRYHLKFC